MSKKLRNLALLGGLGAAAMMMGRKKGESKEDMERDAREDAVSGPLKETKSDKATKAMGKALMKGDKADKDTADTTPSVRKPPADSGAVRTPGRTMPSRTEGLTPSLFGAEMGEGSAERESAPRRPRARDENLGSMGDVIGAKKGGMIKSSASRRADGCAIKGKTRGRMV
jgi:hypothetical protein